MRAKVHGVVIVLFVLAGICFAAHWLGAAIAIAVIGIFLEGAAWLAWVDKNRDEPSDTEEH